MLSFKRYIITEVEAEQVPLTLSYHSRLCSDLWSGTKLKTKVRTTLLKIAEQFEEFLEAPDIKVIDIILTGSMANYNWTTLSDIDVHLIVDIEESDNPSCPLDIADTFFTKKALWGERHDIKIYGHPVELYVQFANEEVYATGIFSLTMDKWIDKPNRSEKGKDFDKYAVKVKAAEWMTKIDDAISSKASAETITNLKEKIRTMRQSGLEEGGEFSIENLAFKVLRNNGYIEKLSKYKDEKQDKELSLR